MVQGPRGGQQRRFHQCDSARNEASPDVDGDGEEGEEERQREIDRSFRRWLGRKKRQAQSERESKERKEELLNEHRWATYRIFTVLFTLSFFAGGFYET